MHRPACDEQHVLEKPQQQQSHDAGVTLLSTDTEDKTGPASLTHTHTHTHTLLLEQGLNKRGQHEYSTSPITHTHTHTHTHGLLLPWSPVLTALH